MGDAKFFEPHPQNFQNHDFSLEIKNSNFQEGMVNVCQISHLKGKVFLGILQGIQYSVVCIPHVLNLSGNKENSLHCTMERNNYHKSSKYCIAGVLTTDRNKDANKIHPTLH